MNIQNAKIIVSAVRAEQYPKDNLPEIALAGRSNVGKSSFVNKMLQRKNLARTSSVPGKTAQINFYNIDNKFYFVDLPGYGYAAVSKQEKKKWSEMMDEYLNTRKNLHQTILLVDSRHKPSSDDIQMAKWIRYCFGTLIVVATKLDKLKKSEIERNMKLIKETLEIGEDDYLIPFSSEKGFGRDEAWELINMLI